MKQPLCRTLILLSVFCCGTAFSAEPSTSDLIRKLAEGTESDRVEARQLLPRREVETVAKILPLLDREDQAVWRTVFNILSDFANEVSVPGREKDRALVASYFMTLISPDQTDRARELGLRLLPLVVPAGFDVSPVARLLEDGRWREKARAALEEMGTPEARGALRRALAAGPDPDFAVALIRSLGALKDEGGREILTTLLSSDEGRIRAAAARALAPMSDATQVPAFKTVYHRAIPGTEFETGEALLLLADTIAVQGEYPEIAMRLYRTLVESSTVTPLVGAAIIQMGRRGDASVLPGILAEARSNPDLEPAALAAIELLLGHSDVSEVLLTAYPDLSRSMRCSLLEIFGQCGKAVFEEVLAQESTNEDLEIRISALRGLADSGFPSAVDLLVQAGKEGPPEGMAAAARGLLRLARLAAHEGNAREAARRYLALLRLAQDQATREIALEGLSRFPTEAELEAVLECLNDPDLSSVAAEALTSLTQVLVGEGKKDEARQVLSRFVARLDRTDLIRRILESSGGLGEGADLAARLGFVTEWWVVGPFPWQFREAFDRKNIGEPDIDLEKRYSVNGEVRKWTRHVVQNPGGVVNLVSLLGSQPNVCAYAFAEIEVDRETPAVLRVGSDDGVKIWVNGQSVHENNTSRGSDLDQDLISVVFKKGKNRILLQITQGAGGWDFRVRLTKKDGTPFDFRQPGS